MRSSQRRHVRHTPARTTTEAPREHSDEGSSSMSAMREALPPVHAEPTLLDHAEVVLGADRGPDGDELRAPFYGAMFDEDVQHAVGHDPELFDALYRRTTEAHPVQTLVGPSLGAEAYTTREQLQYELGRVMDIMDGLAPGPDVTDAPELRGLRPGHMGAALAELGMHTQDRLAQLDDGLPVRMPDWHHRTKPGGFDGIREAREVSYSETAQQGPGSYVSSDLNEVYGPIGFSFDARDLHQRDLSTKSEDNRKKFTEQSTGEASFRAMSSAIDFASVPPASLMSTEEHRDRVQAAHVGAPVVSIEAANLERLFREELQGRFEPHHWARHWEQSDAFHRAIDEQLAQMVLPDVEELEGVDPDEWGE